MTGFFSIAGLSEVEQIHNAALATLDGVGVKVESPELLELLDDYGGRADVDAQRIQFSPSWVEQFIAESEKYDWESHVPRLDCFAGIYQSLYLDPETGELEPFTEQTLADYIRLGNALEEVGSVGLLGLPFTPEAIAPSYTPLAEKLYAWKYGASPAGTVQLTGLCPYLEETFARWAEEVNRPLQDVFSATGYLVSPLRLPRSECEQLLYFRSRGLRMGIGHMLSAGGSTPITIAGAAVMKLAETLFLSILQRALWGGTRLAIGGFGVVMDMLGARSMGGRPEAAMVSAVMSLVARHYRVRSHGTGPLTDAKEPSVQAGMQKAMIALYGVCSCGGASIDVGLLSLDEISSPEQMVYDVELASAVRHMLRPMDVSSEACAVEEIAAVGPGGNFIGTDLTAKRFRQDQWQPRIWDRDSLQEWVGKGGESERDRARERIRGILSEPQPTPSMSEKCERDLRAIIARAMDAGAAERS